MPRSQVALAAAVAGLCLSAAACSSCASAQVRTVTVETAAVEGVHLVIQAEKSAYQNGAISRAQHQKDLTLLAEVVKNEDALNDSLIAWANNPTGSIPAVAATVINDLQVIAGDVTALAQKGGSAVAADTAAKAGTTPPVVSAVQSIQPLLSAIAAVLADITPGGGGSALDVNAK